MSLALPRWVLEPQPEAAVAQRLARELGVPAALAALLIQRGFGGTTEARAFRPHVTLGRTAREARPRAFAGFEEALGRLECAQTALVEGLDLMRSTLQSGGAVYHVRHSERLP